MTKQNLIIPIFGTLASKLEPLALPMLRVIVGLVFIYHGNGKFFTLVSGGDLGWLEGMISEGGLPFPILFVWLTAITE
ncbi:MAG: DoxX family protein, partial [Alphaproteobacteria bacterium]